LSAVLHLKKGRDESLERFHPWLFSGAVASIEGNPQDGDVVEIRSASGAFRATGHYQHGSIAVRILSFTPSAIDDRFWLHALQTAYRLRRDLRLANHPQTTAYRLVHGEGDFLPGLVIDIYGATAVIQTHSAGMSRMQTEIAAALQTIYGAALQRIYCKSAAAAPDSDDRYLAGSPPATAGDVIMENGHRFIVDWETGQKTGFFLDQRDNRRLLAHYAQGRRVLNLFCYTGGFSVYAGAAGAAAVHSVDSSAKAIELTRQNATLNAPHAPHEAFVADAFEFLKQAPDNAYDLLIVDPPAFAKHAAARRNALQAYKRLNALAIAKTAPGGLLFTFSCSQIVSRTDFRQAVFSAAAIAQRPVRILHHLSQPPDHPVNIYHPEGEYLKGLALTVSNEQWS
jgi:23S rRNA (cytosine1962-C5)-methyltransferase